jgi:hypothetical protein
MTGAGEYYQHNASSRQFLKQTLQTPCNDFVQNTNTKLIVITLVTFFVEGTPS